MSAFICSVEHLTAIVDTAIENQPGYPNYLPERENMVLALAEENTRAVNYRYDETEEVGEEYRIVSYRPKKNVVSIVQAMKLLQSYRYQCDEGREGDPSVVTTMADNLTDRFDSIFIGSLPGYEIAKWSI